MKNSKLAIWILSVVVLIGVAFGGVWYYQTNQETNSTEETTQTESIQSKSIAYDGEDGKTVYDLLKEKYQVEATEGSYGVMVNSINGLAATDSEFWLYSVNGQSGDVSADKMATKNGDQVLWEYKGF